MSLNKDEIVKAVREQEKQALQGSVYGSTLGDQYKPEVYELATKLKMPPSMVNRNYAALSQQQQVNQNYDDLVQQSPTLAKWLQDAENAKLAAKDIENLSYIERQMKYISTSYEQGNMSVELSDIGQAAVNEAMGGDPVSPEMRARQKELAGKLGPNNYGITGFFEQIPGSTAGQIPIQIRTFRDRLAATGVGATTGATIGAVGALIAGQAGPQVAVPEEVVTVPAAALSGAGIGGRAGWKYGSAVAAGRMEMNMAYLDYENLKDENGQPVDKRVALGAAGLVGTVNGLVEMVGFEKYLSKVPGIRKFTREGVRDMLMKPTTGAAIRRYASTIAQIMATEGATEAFQAITKKAGELVLNKEYASAEDFLADLFSEQNLGQYMQEARVGAQSGGGMTAVTATHQLALDVREVKKAEQRERAFLELGEAMKKSSTVTQTPETAGKLVEQMSEGEVYIEKKQWDTYWQGKGVDPKEAAKEVLGDTTEYESLADDIRIPITRYATKIAPTEHNQFFASEIKLEPDGMSARQAVELEQAMDRVTPEQEDTVKPVIVERLMAAGYTKETAESYAEQNSAFIHTMAERAGTTPEAIMDKYGFDVEREAMPAEIVDEAGEVVREDRRAPDTVASVPVMITQKMRAGLRNLGYTDTEIGKLTPQEAHAILTPKTPGDRRTGQAGRGDRRKDVNLREEFDALPPDEKFRIAYSDPLTGLLNKRAFDNLPPKRFRVAFDGDSLGWINDHGGHGTGDKFLKYVAQALLAQFGPMDAFRTGGDEFWGQADTLEEAQAKAQAAREFLKTISMTVNNPGQEPFQVRGIGLSYGIGETDETADLELLADKERREASGERARKTEQPPGVTYLGSGDSSRAGEAGGDGRDTRPDTLNQSPLKKPAGSGKVTLPSKTEILSVLKDHPFTQFAGKARRVFVVGSFAEGRQGSKSDIDVLIEVDKGASDLQNEYRNRVADYFVKNNIRGVRDDLHPQWQGRRVDVYFTENAERDAAGRAMLEITDSTQQTETEAFKLWFKNSAVVDSRGRPLVVYHGTAGKDFGEFEDRNQRQGFYFTRNAEYANLFTESGPEGGSRIIPAFLSIQKPADLRDYNGELIDDLASAGYERADDMRDMPAEDYWMLFDGATELREALEALGYDGVRLMEPISIQMAKSGEYVDSWLAFHPSQIKSAIGNTGQFSDTNPNILFQSAKKKIEPKPENLVVTHNLSAENLEFADRIGGLAVPSMGIVNADIDVMDGYGEITLIANKDLIDPQRDRDSKVFDADVYSPRYPTVRFKADQKVLSQIREDLEESAGEIGESIYSIDKDRIEDNGIGALYDSELLQYEFLKGKGIKIAPVFRKKKKIHKELAKFKGQESHDLIESNEFKAALKRVLMEEVENNTKKLVGSDKLSRKEVSEIRKMFRDGALDEDGNIHYRTLDDYATAVSKANNPPEVDRHATHTLIRKAINKVEPDFRKWVKDKYGNVIESERIFNGFTYSGKKKWLPHDLDTVVRLLKKELRAGEGFNYGAGDLRATVARQFRTIKQMQESRDKIISGADFSKLKDEIQNELAELAEKFRPKYKYAGNEFGFYDRFTDVVKEGVKKKRLSFELESDFEVDADDIQEVRDFLDKLRNMPTEYFEAKVQRAVGLQEFSAAVVPIGTEQEVLDTLAKHGITDVQFYKKGDRESRRKAVRELSEKKGVLFAKRLMPKGRPQDYDYLVPETEAYAGNETGDLAYTSAEEGIEALPIKLHVGRVIGPHRGFGLRHIVAEADSSTRREAPTVTQDRAENFTRQIAEIAQSYNEVYRDGGDKVVLRNSKLKLALIVQPRERDGEQYYSVVTVTPSEKAVWGDPVWTSRGQLPSGRLRQPGAPGSHRTENQARDSGVNPVGVQTEQFKLSPTGDKKQPTITVKKRKSFNTKDMPEMAKVAHTRAAAGAGAGMTTADVQKVVDEFKKSLNGVPGVQYSVAKTQEEAFGQDAALLGQIKGGYYQGTGKIILIAENLESREDALKILRHETIAHFGFDILPQETKAAIIKKITDARETTLKSLWDSIGQDYAEASDETKAKEILARLAEDPNGTLSRIWNEIVLLVQAALKKMNLIDKGVTKAELRDLLQSMADGIRRGPRNAAPGALAEAIYSKRLENLSNTKAFRNWFGKSIMTVDGKPGSTPLVVYHGSAASDMTVFDRAKIGTVQVSDWGKGFYFTPSSHSAAYYAEEAMSRANDPEGDRLYDEYEKKARELGTRPMYESIDLGFGSEKYKELEAYLDRWRDHKAKFRQENRGTVYPAYLKIEKPLFYKYVGITEPDMHQQAMANGYDGILIVRDAEEGDSFADTIEEIVVFRPEQIKSVANRGTFDPNDPNILFAKNADPQTETPEFKNWFKNSYVTFDNKPGSEPRVVYHGSDTAGFNTFDEYETGRNTNAADGFYFTNSRMNAATYSGSRSEKDAQVSEGEFDRREDGEPGIYPVYLSMQNPLIIDFEGRNWDGMNQDGQYDGFSGMNDAVNQAKEGGYDGLIAVNVSDEGKHGQGYNWGDTTYVVFKPEQIKSATLNKGSFDPNNPNILYQSPVFYSGLKRAAESLKQETGTAEQFLAAMKKQPGVKQEELQWTGLEEYLKAKQSEGQKVTKAEIVSFLEKNGVQVETIELGQNQVPDETRYVISEEDDGLYSIIDTDRGVSVEGGLSLAEAEDVLMEYEQGTETEDSTNYSNYQLPGGSNYREVLLTLPIDREAYAKSLVDPAAWSRMTEEQRQQFIQGPIRGDNKTTFKSSHFKQPNILAHLRINDRIDTEGNSVLFIEELQSDWHQRGRKEGYRERPEPVDTTGWHVETKKVFEYTGQREIKIYDQRGDAVSWRSGFSGTDEEAIADAARDRAEQKNRDRVPDAPFKNNAWAELAIKRVIRLAAEEGYDKVAWATGEQQVDRFSLGTQVESIAVRQSGENLFNIEGFIKGDSRTGEYTPIAKNVPSEKLDEYVGKELADKIRSDEFDGSEWKEYGGEDLKVGGEGMKAFYDKIIPNIFKKVAGKLDKDSKISSIHIGVGINTMDEEIHHLVDFDGNHTIEHRGQSREFDNEADALEYKSGLINAAAEVMSIDITDAMREAAMAGQPLFQSPTDGDMEENRGGIEISPDRRLKIHLLKNADLSTYIHENGHAYLEVLRDMVKQLSGQSGLSENQKGILKDAEIIAKWLGIDSLDNIKREHHEQFARGFEAYTFEGKAPSISLQRAFARFRSWMLAIYKQLKNLDVSLNDDVRGVFDRMLATDTQIQEAKTQADLTPIFSSKPESMSDEVFNAYRNALEKANISAREHLQQKLLKEMMRERKQQWKDEFEKVSKQVEDELNRRKNYIALSVLQTGKYPDGREVKGEIKLDRDSILKSGFDKNQMKRLNGMDVYRVEGGMDIDLAAQLFGYPSGPELVNDLLNTPKKAAAIAREARRRMLAEHGDIFSDAAEMAEAAKQAVLDESRSEVVHQEMKALNEIMKTLKPVLREEQRQRREGMQLLRSVPKLATLKFWASNEINRIRIKDLRPDKYWATMKAAGREALKAVNERNYQKAYDQKQKELLNLELYRQAVTAIEEADSIAKYLRKFDRTPIRERLGKVNRLEQVDALLEMYDLHRISNKQIDANKAKRELLTAIETGEISAPREFVKSLAGSDRKNYRDETIEVLRGLRDTLRQMDKQAINEYEVMVEGEKMVLGEKAYELAEAVFNTGKTVVPTYGQMSPEEKLGKTFKNLINTWFRPGTMARLLDGSDHGAWTKNIIEPIRKAMVEKLEPMLRKGQEDLKDLYMKHYTVKEMMLMNERSLVPGIYMSLSRWDLIALALNWGNAENRKAVLEGRFAGSKPLTESGVLQALGTLDKRDWEFVKDTWAYIDTYWPQIQAAQKRRRGIAPPKVEADPFTMKTRDGVTMDLPGGYYPLKYNKEIDPKAQQKEMDSLFDAMKLSKSAHTKYAHNQERIGSGGQPVDLSMNVLHNHINHVVRDLALGDTVIYVDKLLKRAEVKQAMTATGNLDGLKTFQLWLKDTAVGEMGARSGAEATARFLRLGFTKSKIGFNVVTTVLQLAGIPQTIVVVGKKAFAQGTQDYLKNPKQAVQQVMAQSKFMYARYQLNAFNKDIQAVQEALKTGSPSTAAKNRFLRGFLAVAKNLQIDRFPVLVNWMFLGIRYSQMQVDTITWLAGYNKAKEMNLNDEESIKYADSQVDKAQGSGIFSDRSSSERGTLSEDTRQTEFVKLWTTLMSYMIAKGNIAVERYTETDFRKLNQIGSFMVDMMMLFSAEILLTAAIKGDYPDDDESWWWWLTKRTLEQAISTIPVLREIPSFTKGYGASGGPLGAFAKDAGSVLTQWDQGEFDKAFVKSHINILGTLTGAPSAQINRTLDAYWRETEGEDVPAIEYFTGSRN